MNLRGLLTVPQSFVLNLALGKDGYSQRHGMPPLVGGRSGLEANLGPSRCAQPERRGRGIDVFHKDNRCPQLVTRVWLH